MTTKTLFPADTLNAATMLLSEIDLLSARQIKRMARSVAKREQALALARNVTSTILLEASHGEEWTLGHDQFVYLSHQSVEMTLEMTQVTNRMRLAPAVVERAEAALRDRMSVILLRSAPSLEFPSVLVDCLNAAWLGR